MCIANSALGDAQNLEHANLVQLFNYSIRIVAQRGSQRGPQRAPEDQKRTKKPQRHKIDTRSTQDRYRIDTISTKGLYIELTELIGFVNVMVCIGFVIRDRFQEVPGAVSYTHLTLPTIYSV